jgi:hypothetical protein
MSILDIPSFRSVFHGQVFEPANIGYARTEIVRRGDLCDCRARKPVEFPSFLSCSRVLWRRRRPGSERSHRIPHRHLPWDILFLAQWTDPAQTDMHRDWARSGEEILRPFSENAHLLSALDVEADDVIQTAFGPNLPRLAAIKKKYDPTNFFRVNHNINPVTQAGGA